ncbi:phage portal protein [Ligilactobacillus equi DSM 15833 = JCM 10991]|uniref:Phage portal protein n=1 Tax=Ligilactobacillus equi DSM 15833 = JCM 10991 TaxID=1423740 RepID=A0A0R1T5G0_9LACO|nr:phage portal protein [Ligilactobacillus equi DSM 15833 = JCM 10991]
METRDWATDLLEDNILPSVTNSAYVGISALKNSDVLTAVGIIGSMVGRYRLIMVDDKTDDTIHDDNVEYLVNKKPNSKMDSYSWRFAMSVNALLTGDGISRIVRDPRTNKPSLIQYFKPSDTYIDDSNLNDIKYIFYTNDGKEIVEKPDNVLHFKFFSDDGIHGRSPLLSLRNEITLQENGVDTLMKFFKGGLKGAVLKATGKLSKEARRKMREEFEYAQRGSVAGSPIIVDSTMDYQNLEVDTNILSLINSNDYTTNQIAKAMHIPAYKLGVNSPNQSIKQLQSDFINSDLPYYFKPILAEMESKLLSDRQRSKMHLEFDTRKETGLSMEEAVSAVNAGLLTPNEALEASGRAKSKEPNMDRYQSTLNTVFLDSKEEYQLKGGGMNGYGNKTNPNQD